MYSRIREYIKNFNDWYSFITAIIFLGGIVWGYFHTTSSTKLNTPKEAYYAGPEGASVATEDGLYYAGPNGASYIPKK